LSDLRGQLKGGDALLYHALKLYKVAPVLHWSAGGYIWPVERAVEIANDEPAPRRSPPSMLMSQHLPPMHGAFSNNSPRMPGAIHGVGREAPTDILRLRVEESGAILLADAEVALLSDWRAPPDAPVGKARVHFVSEGMLEKLVVNVLLVAFVH
jgi:hypothetical protein